MSIGSRFQDPLETWGDKFSRKFKENPWVPLGCLATCGALAMSAVKMRAGKSTSMNYWLRARVVLQGVTLVALVGGSMALQGKENTNTQISDLGIDEIGSGATAAELSQEKKKLLEKQEFEERLKAAQAAAEQEEGFGGMTVKGPSVNKDRREEAAVAAAKKEASTQTQQTDASQSPISSGAKRSNGWLWWSSGNNSEPQVKNHNSDSMP